jgi:hypothetical protein
MRGRRPSLRHGLNIGEISPRRHLAARLCISVLMIGACLAPVAHSQSGPLTCTTQSAMGGDQRQALADTALALATAVKANDTSRVQTMSSSEIASNFDSTTFLIHQTSAAITGSTLRVSQLFLLDASKRQAGDTTVAEFTCTLSGNAGEVDFAIPGLPAGIYAFAVVDALGDRPWMLPILFQQQGSAWKMAGFYPHARTAAGHDGLWYWTTARADAKAGKHWRAWVLYGLADQLLRPANFVTTTHLDQLRSERHSSAPGELTEGIGPETPLVIKAKDGSEFHFTSISSAATGDDKGLDLVLRYRADSAADTGAAHARNLAAASALLAAHPELREGFAGVSVFADIQGQTPFATEHSLSEIH